MSKQNKAIAWLDKRGLLETSACGDEDVASLVALLVEVENEALERTADEAHQLAMTLRDPLARIGAGACEDAIRALRREALEEAERTAHDFVVRYNKMYGRQSREGAEIAHAVESAIRSLKEKTK